MSAAPPPARSREERAGRRDLAREILAAWPRVVHTGELANDVAIDYDSGFVPAHTKLGPFATALALLQAAAGEEPTR